MSGFTQQSYTTLHLLLLRPVDRFFFYRMCHDNNQSSLLLSRDLIDLLKLTMSCIHNAVYVTAREITKWVCCYISYHRSSCSCNISIPAFPPSCKQRNVKSVKHIKCKDLEAYLTGVNRKYDKTTVSFNIYAPGNRNYDNRRFQFGYHEL